MQTVIGNIPKKIIYISKQNNPEGPIPAFIADPLNKKNIETGNSWVRGKSKHDIQENTPRGGYRIKELEVRGEGGRAYKVISPDNYYVDFREDVLLDTILNSGIQKGELIGQFIWARVGSQMKLVRVGSELHNALIQSTKLKSLSKISNKYLEVGGMYRSANGTLSVYLGRVDSTEFEYNHLSFSYYNTSRGYQINKKELNNLMLWYGPYSSLEPQKVGKELREDLKNGNFYSFSVKSSQSVVEKVGTIAVPDNLINKISDAGKKYIKTFQKPSSEICIRDLCFCSSVVLIRKAGEPFVLPEEYLLLDELDKKSKEIKS